MACRCEFKIKLFRLKESTCQSITEYFSIALHLKKFHIFPPTLEMFIYIEKHSEKERKKRTHLGIFGNKFLSRYFHIFSY